jgi:hypothetical protein
VKHTGSITYVSVNSAQGFWEFTGAGYAVGSGTFKTLSIDGIMDTGTTLLLLPDAVVNAYYAKVSGAQFDNSQGGYTFSCESTLPDLTLGIGSYKAVVPGDYINFAPTGDGDSESLLPLLTYPLSTETDSRFNSFPLLSFIINLNTNR